MSLLPQNKPPATVKEKKTYKREEICKKKNYYILKCQMRNDRSS